MKCACGTNETSTDGTGTRSHYHWSMTLPIKRLIIISNEFRTFLCSTVVMSVEGEWLLLLLWLFIVHSNSDYQHACVSACLHFAEFSLNRNSANPLLLWNNTSILVATQARNWILSWGSPFLLTSSQPTFLRLFLTLIFPLSIFQLPTWPDVSVNRLALHSRKVQSSILGPDSSYLDFISFPSAFWYNFEVIYSVTNVSFLLLLKILFSITLAFGAVKPEAV